MKKWVIMIVILIVIVIISLPKTECDYSFHGHYICADS